MPELDRGANADTVKLLPRGVGLRRRDVVEFVADPDVAVLATGSVWRGMANLRGELIAVADVGELLGNEATSGSILVAVSDGETTVGLLCDGVEGDDSSKDSSLGSHTEQPAVDKDDNSTGSSLIDVADLIAGRAEEKVP